MALNFNKPSERLKLGDTTYLIEDGTSVSRIHGGALNFGPISPNQTSKTLAIQLRVTNVIAIKDIEIGLINTGDIDFSKAKFGIEVDTQYIKNKTINNYFEGVNENKTQNNSFNISVPNKNRTQSVYVYVNVTMPPDLSFDGVVRYMWFFNHTTESIEGTVSNNESTGTETGSLDTLDTLDTPDTPDIPVEPPSSENLDSYIPDISEPTGSTSYISPVYYVVSGSSNEEINGNYIYRNINSINFANFYGPSDRNILAFRNDREPYVQLYIWTLNGQPNDVLGWYYYPLSTINKTININGVTHYDPGGVKFKVSKVTYMNDRALSDMTPNDPYYNDEILVTGVYQ
jgi:hypothetical protein